MCRRSGDARCVMSQIQGSGSSSYALQWQYLQSIQQQNTDPMLQPGAGDPSFGLGSSAGASGQTQAAGSGSGPASLLSLGTMSALIDAQAQSSANGLSRDQQRVFGELDANSDGSVSSSELQNAFGSSNSDIAKYVMGKLDTNGDGSISTDEFKAGTTRHAGHHHMHMPPPPDGSQDAQNGQGAQDPLQQLLSADGASSSSNSNADGSTTTTITYADGSKVSMTSAAAASGDGSKSAGTTIDPQKNLLEQLIKMQSQLIQSMSASASTSASLATI
jgi:EF hand domain-containing protein